MSIREVAVLFARVDSIYKTMPACDVWDAERDARRWTGGAPIVGHPPCAQWSSWAAFAHKNEDVKALAPWCVDRIREEGGVLEHPTSSRVWKFKSLPEPGGLPDEFGGWTLEVDQFRWGHKAEKMTRLYIVGCPPEQIPTIPPRIGEPTHTMRSVTKEMRAAGYKPELLKKDRDKTPPAFAAWLVELARMTRKPSQGKP